MERTVAFYTLGCKLNFAESSTISRDLVKNGFQRVNFLDPADLYVINTCSVTRTAEKKCRKMIRQVLKRSPEAFVTVIGCYAQLNPSEIAMIPGISLILGEREKFHILRYLNSLNKKEKAAVHCCEIKEINDFISSYSIDERTRAFLKVQDGCNYACSYCTIPLARGKSRSEPISRLIAIAKEIAENDIREIVLTGVNIGEYGSGKEGEFLNLLRALERIKRIQRFRISSIEPNLLSDEIIEFVANSEKFMPHFHIPLQSGSNKILKLMRRRYSKELYADRINKVKSLIPDCCIGADIIVGFPNESEEDFFDTYHFIQKLDISYLHIFTYSERPNTPAIKIQNPVPKSVKIKRSKMLHQLSNKKRYNFYNLHLKKIRNVLFESEDKGMMCGFTDNYIKVKVSGSSSLHNKIRKVKLLENRNEYIIGELVR